MHVRLLVIQVHRLCGRVRQFQHFLRSVSLGLLSREILFRRRRSGCWMAPRLVLLSRVYRTSSRCRGMVCAALGYFDGELVRRVLFHVRVGIGTVLVRVARLCPIPGVSMFPFP